MPCPHVTHTDAARAGAKFCPTCGIALDPAPNLNPDYVTVLACANPQKAIVAVMNFIKADDSYEGRKFSEPLSQARAKGLAESWAAALGLEVR